MVSVQRWATSRSCLGEQRVGVSGLGLPSRPGCFIETTGVGLRPVNCRSIHEFRRAALPHVSGGLGRLGARLHLIPHSSSTTRLAT